jgi:archaeosortase A (PGF-CTERM-specific)
MKGRRPFIRQMVEPLIFLSCLFFFFSLISGKHQRFTAIIAWVAMVAVLMSGVPAWVDEANILYPVMALLSIPFLYITIILLLREEKVILQLTRAAGVACIIYAPFAFYEPLGNALIGLVVQQTGFILNLAGFQYYQVLWNTFQHGTYRVEIILACTGIQAIAIMAGVSAAVPTTWRQKVVTLSCIVLPIYILNLIRNTGVIIAYTDQWFSWMPDLTTGTERGYSSFFWAHNIIAEAVALLFLIVLAYGLFKLIPDLADFAADLIDTYRKEIRKISGISR